MLFAILVGFGSFLAFWSIILPYLMKDYRFLNHKLVPNDPKNPKTPIDHAVIIGGSLGGMFTKIVRLKF
jgi:hypothetical protein